MGRLETSPNTFTFYLCAALLADDFRQALWHRLVSTSRGDALQHGPMFDQISDPNRRRLGDDNPKDNRQSTISVLRMAAKTITPPRMAST
jgi:hypothetical protein